MSHFLARLVERARGVAPRVEPIVAPRFAPAPVSEINRSSDAPQPPAAEVEMQLPAEMKRTSPSLVRQENETPPVATEPETLFEVVRETLLVPQTEEPDPPSISVRQVRRDQEKAVFLKPRMRASESRTRPAPKPAKRVPAASIRERPAESPNEPSLEPPIVRVTIGRIDVRAIAPPIDSPRKAKTPPPPILSLDTYLKERKEGRR